MQATDIITPAIGQKIDSLQTILNLDYARLKVWMEKFARRTYREPSDPQSQAHFAATIDLYIKHLGRMDTSLLHFFAEHAKTNDAQAYALVEEFEHFLGHPLGEAENRLTAFESNVRNLLAAHRATSLNYSTLSRFTKSNRQLASFVKAIRALEDSITPIDDSLKSLEALFTDPTHQIENMRMRFTYLGVLLDRFKEIANGIIEGDDVGRRRELLVEFRRLIVQRVDPLHGIMEGLEEYADRVHITPMNALVEFPHVMAMRDRLRATIKAALQSANGGGRRISISFQRGKYTPMSIVTLIANPKSVRDGYEQLSDSTAIRSDLHDVVTREIKGLEVAWMQVRDGAAFSIASGKRIEEIFVMREEPAEPEPAWAGDSVRISALNQLEHFAASSPAMGSLLETFTTIPRFTAAKNATQSSMPADAHLAGANALVRQPSQFFWRARG